MKKFVFDMMNFGRLLEERGIDSLTPLHHAILLRCEPVVVTCASKHDELCI